MTGRDQGNGQFRTGPAHLAPARTSGRRKALACDAMSTATGPGSGLPVRMPRPRQPGRHRRPEALAAPEGAPVLVLAVPGTPTAAALSLAEEVVSIARSELSGLDPRIAFVDGDDGEGEFPGLRAVLDQVAAERPGEETSAVVVPLLAGPE